MSAVPEAFPYKSALVGRRIRLLRIFPASGPEPIRISLWEKELGSDTPFLALSYVWGTPDVTERVICNGKTLNVTKNLYEALWQIREDGCEDYVWADAICINQGDLTEKTEQVRMMADVYGHAELVVVWLGKGEKDDQVGYDLMERLCKRWDGTDPLTARDPNGESNELLQVPAEHFAAMVNLLQRPWFSRAWVVQEFHCARLTTFQSGSLNMSPDAFFGIAKKLDQDRALLATAQRLHDSKIQNRDLIGPFFKFANCGRGQYLLGQLLTASRGLKSSDRRDRIFALVSLSSDADPILIDYGLELQNILAQVAKSTIRTRLDGDEPWLALDSLCSVDPLSGIKNLPSWAATYDLPPGLSSLASIFPLESPPDTVPRVAFAEDNTMSILGGVFDSVSKLIDADFNDEAVIRSESGIEAQFAEIAGVLFAWQSSVSGLLEHMSTYPTGQDLREVRWQSLSFNSANYREKCSANGQESFSAWREGMALNMVYFEHEIGKYTPTSRENVLCRLESLAPDLPWRLQLQIVPGPLDSQFWDTLRIRMQDLSARSLAFSVPHGMWSGHRRYFVSQLGYLGWVPRSAHEGDRICAFSGYRFPFVIRPKGTGFQLIGACYMHGIMEGEATKLPNTDGSEQDIMITLV